MSLGQRIKILLLSKTVWGAVGVAVTYLASNPLDAQHIITAISGFVSAVGVRDAITQHGIMPS